MNVIMAATWMRGKSKMRIHQYVDRTSDKPVNVTIDQAIVSVTSFMNGESTVISSGVKD
jgi:hypothetical protein